MIGAIKLIDRHIGVTVCFILGIIGKAMHLFSAPKLPEKPKKILAIQLWGIGETILMLPAVHALKQKYKDASIDILCTKRNKDVFYGQGFFLKEASLNLFSIKWFCFKNLGKYDVVVDFEEYLNISSIISFFTGRYTIGYSHGIRSLLYSDKVKYDDAKHAALAFLDLAKAAGAGYGLDKIGLIGLKYSEEDKIYVDGLIGKLNMKSIIGITPGAAESSKSRQWPKERFAELAARLSKRYDVAFVGAAYEDALVKDIISIMKRTAGHGARPKRVFNLAGKVSLLQAFCFISRCKAFISNDTGPMHIAAAQGIPTIGLFGPNLPSRFGPLGKGNIGLYHKIGCSPCINVHKGQVPECRFNDAKCMKRITVEEVIGAVEMVNVR